MVKNPNWREADQLAIYKRSRDIELEATENNISWRSERDLNPRPTDFKSGALTTRPRCLHPTTLPPPGRICKYINTGAQNFNMNAGSVNGTTTITR